MVFASDLLEPHHKAFIASPTIGCSYIALLLSIDTIRLVKGRGRRAGGKGPGWWGRGGQEKKGIVIS